MGDGAGPRTASARIGLLVGLPTSPHEQNTAGEGDGKGVLPGL